MLATRLKLQIYHMKGYIAVARKCLRAFKESTNFSCMENKFFIFKFGAVAKFNVKCLKKSS